MYGLIYSLLHKFVQRKLGTEGWHQALQGAGLEKETFLPSMSYPDEKIFSLIYTLAKKAKLPVDALLLEFGKALAPDLRTLHPGLIKSHWKTLDVIEHTASVIHEVVRQMMKGSTPPSIQCVRLSETEAQLIYASSRKLCALAKGLVEGFAEIFGEKVEIQETSCMHKGDPFCFMNVQVTGKLAAGPVAFTPLDFQDLGEAIGDVESWEMHQLKLFFDHPQQHDELGRLGNYAIRKLIGSGGMGLVFEAVDLESKTTLALKLIKPEMMLSEDNRIRFLREARLMSELESPYVVPLVQVGSYRGVPFIVMPYLKGCTLDAWPKLSKPVTLGFLHMLGRNLGLGLQAAHARMMIHRDIKPGNVWIAENQNSAQIMDFGLVLNLNESQRVTRVGMMMGTISYMAPEQLCDGKLNEQADLFSLGIILWQMVTGKLPFGQSSFLVHIKKVMTERPVAPHQENPLVPAELSAPILRLLEQDLGARTRNASSFIQEWEEAFRQLAAHDPAWEKRVVFNGPFSNQVEERTKPWTPDIGAEAENS